MQAANRSRLFRAHSVCDLLPDVGTLTKIWKVFRLRLQISETVSTDSVLFVSPLRPKCSTIRWLESEQDSFLRRGWDTPSVPHPNTAPQHTLSLYFFLSLSRTCGGNDCKLIPLLFLYLSICSPPTTTPQVGKCSRPPLRRSSVVLSLSLSPHNNTWTPRHSITYLRTYIRQMKASLYCELVWESQRSHTHSLSLSHFLSHLSLSLLLYLVPLSSNYTHSLSLFHTHNLSLTHRSISPTLLPLLCRYNTWLLVSYRLSFKSCLLLLLLQFSHTARKLRVTRLGYFWKVSGTYSLTKLALILIKLLCDFKILGYYVKTALATFWGTLVKIGLLLILASGHTARGNEHKRFLQKWSPVEVEIEVVVLLKHAIKF